MSDLEWDLVVMSGSGNGSIVTSATLVPPCIPIPAYHPTFIIVMQALVSATTFLSMLGSILIVGTFIAFKNLRTRARQILVQLSIADFAVAASQLVGVNVNLQRYAGQICTHQEHADLNITSDMFCKVQGGLTIFFTVSSFFWTVAVAIYLLTIIVFESQRVGKWLTYLSYPVCWGIPAIVVMAFGLRKSIGFHANVDTGWCFVTSHSVANTHTATISEVAAQVFVYLTFTILLIVYLWIRCSIRCKIRRVSNKASLSYNLRLKAKNADAKLTFIPLVFVLLRMWGAALGVVYIYMPHHTRHKFRETEFNATLVLFHAIGSSAQGLTNALLFCVFTSMVRKRLTRFIRQLFCCVNCRKDEGVYLLEPSTDLSGKADREKTTQYDEEECPVLTAKEAKVVDFARKNSTTHDDMFRGSIENSKYHSISVGKRVTLGAE